MSIAVVTGASSGMGAVFCHSLDAEGLDSVWIVARSAGKLEALSDELATPCRIITADLSTSSGVDSLLSILDSEKPDIRYLVNCAGAGRFGNSWEIPVKETRSMIGLNISALVDITNHCVPYMKKGSSIIEVCSASAYLPLKELNVYAASKAFVHAYTEGLRLEVKSLGIRVLEVSPGWVETDFIQKTMETTKVPSKVFKHTVTKEQVVTQAMADLSAGKKRSICGPYNRFQVFCCVHFPWLASRIWNGSLNERGA